ncbi:MAG TPA: ELWxxDGT repeat protein, partial [Roseiflexaceae bacterium]|nr:ELWxxDGT repeat protein [Roseiflexaceae bacterium]
MNSVTRSTSYAAQWPRPGAARLGAALAVLVALAAVFSAHAAGPAQLVQDINTNLNPGPSSFPSEFETIGAVTYFAATDSSHGSELWKTDGTAAGTLLVRDINPGFDGSTPQNLTKVGGTLYFTADDGTAGRELWKSDGTSAGTTLVKDISPGASSGFGFFAAPDLTDVNGTLYFVADDGLKGAELWKSDGTAAGTVLVKDIVPGSGSAFPSQLTNVDGTLFFVATTLSAGQELWKSNGT